MNRQCMASDARRRRGPLPPLSLRKSTLWEMSHQVWGEAHILSLGSAIDETRYVLQLPSSLYSHEAKRNKSFLIYSQPNLQKKSYFSKLNCLVEGGGSHIDLFVSSVSFISTALHWIKSPTFRPVSSSGDKQECWVENHFLYISKQYKASYWIITSLVIKSSSV